MEKPILFSTEMVRAILNGRKTQTRRVVKIPKQWISQGITHDDLEKSGFWNCWQSIADDPTAGHRWQYGDEWLPNQNYQIGDRLWVREAWFNPSDGLFKEKEPFLTYYRADSEIDFKWKPSIFMPKEYARIWLEIINVRVERLQDISYQDVRREGLTNIRNFELFGDANHRLKVHQIHFKILWDSINGKKHPWSDNPWVWVVEFKAT